MVSRIIVYPKILSSKNLLEWIYSIDLLVGMNVGLENHLLCLIYIGSEMNFHFITS